MEHSAADESDVALADLPSTSGARWANRDSERRRSYESSTPFRRPPAVNSFPEGSGGDGAEAGWDAFAPAGSSEDGRLAWFGNPRGNAEPAADTASWGDRGSHRRTRDDTTAPARASFGVTDGPISGARPEPVPDTGEWPAPGATGD
ncbi:MAG TPA: hypothetical protein VFH03_11605, partial [Actinoplanes sp.]|nr:hypothetical protein [Actinoplanes sp.]